MEVRPMRTTVFAAMVLSVLLGAARTSSAGCFGLPCGVVPYAPALSVYAPPAFYAAPLYYPYPYSYPYPYAYSYFRPEGPYGYNGARNWRDTWQDDGVKVHAYTLR